MIDTLAFQMAAAFGAGMILNFMPCVLPVVPFKVQALLRETSGTSRSRMLAAVALLAGSLAFFVLLGAVTAGFGLMWGQQFQLPWFRLSLSLLLVAAAIATFTGWSWRLPQTLYRLPMSRHLGAFFTGALAGILSTPCSGPFLGSVLAYAATRSAAETMVLFSSIGAGLAFPYVTLMLRPGLLQRLTFNYRLAANLKTVLGFVLLAGGLFFAQGFMPALLRSGAWLGLALGFGIWVVVQTTAGNAQRRRLRPVLLLALAMVAITGFKSLSLQESAGAIAWRAYTDQRIVQAAGRPVLLEFTADWCINCKALEQTTFKDPKLVQTIIALGVTPLKVDLTLVDDGRRDLFARYGGRAIPFVVLLDGRGEAVQRFTGMVGADTLIDSLQSIGG